MHPGLLLAGILSLTPQAADTGSRSAALVVSGFVDLYYAYDFGRPAGRDRTFTTQAARHNEVNLNLGHVALALQRERVRGRLALQAGTSVQVNYAGEPSQGSVSGPTFIRHVQEATAGARVGQDLWLDAGIYLSYIGWESWISRDNPTYTRSLIAEYTPYYLSGIRATWHTAKRLTLQVHLMNGWQKISEDNDSKALGARADLEIGPALAVAYAGFIGNEQPAGSPAATRLFHQLMVKVAPSRSVLIQVQFDHGVETTGGSKKEWYGLAAITRLAFDPGIALSARAERFSDPDQAVAVTGVPVGLVANGASLGLDLALAGGLLWRVEARLLHASEPVFSRGTLDKASRSSKVLVASLALTL